MIRELFENETGQLVDEKTWQERIDHLRGKITPACGQVTDSPDLDAAITHAVQTRATQPTALLLSGGVDSSLLALLLKQSGCLFTAFCIGLEGSPDLDASKRAAEALGIPIVQKTLTLDEMASIIQRLKLILSDAVHDGQNLAVLYGVAAVELAAIEAATAAGYTTVMGGLGSEEIFAGYERHAKAHDINEECWNGLRGMRRRDLVRDSLVAKATGVRLATPYLDAELIATAMKLPGEAKIKDGVKKAALREAAVRLGLPKDFAERPKQAAQYGSKTDKAIERLAKQKGFKTKHDYLLNQAC